MLETTLLETTAEVSIALTGFVGIFLVLTSRDEKFQAKDVVAIRSIVTTSISPVFYSVFPILAGSLGLSEPLLWRVSSGLVVLVSTSVWASIMISIQRWPIEERKPDSGLLAVSSWVCGFLALICHMVNLLAWPLPASAGVYLLGVWFVILIAALYFVDLIFRRVGYD